MIIVIKKLLNKNPRDWHSKLRYSLWEDHIRVKNALKMSPFELVYIIVLNFLFQLNINTMQFMKDYLEAENILETKIVPLTHLEEKQEQSF